MELLPLAQVLAGEDWGSDQVTFQGPQLPSAHRRIRTQQKSTGLRSAPARAGVAAIFRARPQ